MSKNGKIVRSLLQAQHDTAEAREHAKLHDLHREALRLKLKLPRQFSDGDQKHIGWSSNRKRYESDPGREFANTASAAVVHGLVVALTNAIANENKPSEPTKPKLKRRRVS